MLGTRIGPYRFLRKIEEDALGEIFEAVDLGSKKPVAIRALPSEAAKRSQTIERLYSEAKTLALLNHPHIARTYGFIRRPDRLFLVGELIEGETLHTALKAKGRLELPVALAYVHQVLNAVAFAHSLGVIHGDLQPSNIVITHLGQVKVVDFAIALLLGDQDFQRPLPQSECYASPERRRREPIDERSDVYSIGAVLYACLTGHAPFAGHVQRTAHQQCAGVVVDAVAVRTIGNRMDGMLEQSSVVAHAEEVMQLHLRQRRTLLRQCAIALRCHNFEPVSAARLVESGEIPLRGSFPCHRAAVRIGTPAHCLSAHIVGEQPCDLGADRGRIAKRYQDAAPVGEQLASMPVGR